MSLIFNGTTIEKVIFNGTEIEKLIYNGTTVFESSYVIYDNGNQVKALENGVYNFYEYNGYKNLGGWIFNSNNIQRPTYYSENGCYSFCTRDVIDFSKYKTLRIMATDTSWDFDVSSITNTAYLTLAAFLHSNTTGEMWYYISSQKQYFYSNRIQAFPLAARDNTVRYITKIWLE